MKKLAAMAAAAVLVLAMGANAFAAAGSAELEKENQSIDVQAKYESGVTTPEVYSVDVAWGAMEFTYSASGTKDWNADDHSYTENVTASWSASGNTVTVTNHSNAEVDVAFAYNALADYDAIEGAFDVAEDTLAAGVVGGYATADAVTATLTLTGELDSAVVEFTKVGAITVTIS